MNSVNDPLGNRSTLEFNFDGLVGPTHNFAGLGRGNLASLRHRHRKSSPKAAALEGLAKMRRLMSLGVPQAILPPLPRPDLALLRRLGFVGDDAEVLRRAADHAPSLLAIASSGSSMWTANAATVSPSADAMDRRLHITPANLVTSLHRANETHWTAVVLERIFSDSERFKLHPALPSACDFADEGAANHTRFCTDFDRAGVEFFVYGKSATGSKMKPRRFSARQSQMASESIARLHQLNPERVVLAEQNPIAIDAGVFHNDVIAVGHRDLLFFHELAFADWQQTIDSLKRASDNQIRFSMVSSDELSIDDAVATYLFNSQIVSDSCGSTVLVAPSQCEQHPATRAAIRSRADAGLFDAVEFVDVSESMNNGGGPACLRLRVVLSPEEQDSIAQGVILDDHLAVTLHAWIERNYRETLSYEDLSDPSLLDESRRALDELSQILDLGAIYGFQQ